MWSQEDVIIAKGMRRPNRLFLIAIVLGLSATFLGASLPLAAPASATQYAAGTYFIWTDGFASGLTNWTVSDDNPDAGVDSWGTTDVRDPNCIRIGTTRTCTLRVGDPFDDITIWCAQVGTSSGNGVPNSANGYYDRDMAATVVRSTGDLSGFSAAWLNFKYWAVTGSPDDYLSVWELSGGNWTAIWRQPAVDSNGWQGVSVNISTDSTAVAFRFYSSPIESSQGHEGIYIDWARLVGYDSADPTSHLGPLPSHLNTRSVSIEYAAADTGGSGLSGVWLLYSTSPLGPWSWYEFFASSPITFEAPADGTYYFYSVAFDKSGRMEAAPDTSDSWTSVDTRPPTILILSPGAGATLTAPTVDVSWTGSDGRYGVDRFEVALDGGPWISAGTETSYKFTDVSDGAHVVTVRAFDRAGNQQTGHVSFAVNTSPLYWINQGGIGFWVLIGISMALFVILTIALLRRHRGKTPPPTSGGPPEPP